MPPFHPGIVAQYAPIIADAPSELIMAQRTARRDELWRRVGNLARARPLVSTTLSNDADDAETQGIVGGVMGLSRGPESSGAGASSDEEGRLPDSQFEALSNVEPDAHAPEDERISVIAERIGDLPDAGGSSSGGHDGLMDINELLSEIRDM